MLRQDRYPLDRIRPVLEGLRRTGGSAALREVIAERGAPGETLIADLHVWRVGRNAYSCALTVVTHSATLGADAVRAQFSMHEEIVHSTVEIQRCADDRAAGGSGS